MKQMNQPGFAKRRAAVHFSETEQQLCIKVLSSRNSRVLWVEMCKVVSIFHLNVWIHSLSFRHGQRLQPAQHSVRIPTLSCCRVYFVFFRKDKFEKDAVKKFKDEVQAGHRIFRREPLTSKLLLLRAKLNLIIIIHSQIRKLEPFHS